MTATLRHDALLYAGERDYLDGVLPFVRGGIETGEPVFVAVPEPRMRLLQAGLDGARDAVRFADMQVLGRNPGRIIPAVAAFLAEYPDAPARFVGEPIWGGRSAAEIDEATRHEALLNLAFGDFDVHILCPYDTTALHAGVIAHAEHTHPDIADRDRRWRSARYTDPVAFCAADGWALPSPPADAVIDERPVQHLGWLREHARAKAEAAGLDAHRIDDVLIAVNELCTNTIRHGGAGVLRTWLEPRALVCEVRDRGRITDPLAGRSRAALDASHGRGLYLVNQLADLVQLRSSETGSTVRLHFTRGGT